MPPSRQLLKQLRLKEHLLRRLLLQRLFSPLLSSRQHQLKLRQARYILLRHSRLLPLNRQGRFNHRPPSLPLSQQLNIRQGPKKQRQFLKKICLPKLRRLGKEQVSQTASGRGSCLLWLLVGWVFTAGTGL